LTFDPDGCGSEVGAISAILERIPQVVYF
jgi:hypothetical protein